MIEISLYIDEAWRDAFRDRLTEILAMPPGVWGPRIQGVPEDDPDLRDAWEGDLHDALRDDLAFLLGLFEVRGFGSGRALVDEDVVLSAVRALAALRLHARQHTLNALTDEDLEIGDWSRSALTEAVEAELIRYTQLGALQEILVQSLPAASPDRGLAD